MKKSILILIFILLYSLPVLASDYGLLTRAERATAEAIPVTSADIINVAKVEALPGLYFLGILVTLAYWALIYARLKYKVFHKYAKQIREYKKFISQIIRATLGITFIWLGTQNSFFLQQPPPVLKILLFIAAAILITGVFLRYSSLAIIILTIAMFTEGFAPFTPLLEITGLLLVLSTMSEHPLSIDQLIKIKYKRWKTLGAHVYGILRCIVGFSLMSNAAFILSDPKYALMLINKIPALSNMATGPETIIFTIAIAQIILGIFLIIGFFTRIHAATLFAIMLSLFFAIETQGLATIPLLGSAIVLFITEPPCWSVDALFPKK